jgi:glyoxylase-like metal-dependent hydrolase (beta-lactamase superfamily II)
VRAVALHTDVLVATSAIWQTNCVFVRCEDESFLIDSPILPDELDALPALVEQAGFPAPSGLLVTHGDWDHLLGRLAFPGLALGCAESTAARMRATPGAVQRELRDFDEAFAIERPRPLALGSMQELPLPGRCQIGSQELELHVAEGHTADGMAVRAPWAGVLAVGDYLSDCEIPSLAADGGEPDAYCATLERLRPVLQSVDHVIPGHGGVLDGARALELLEEDLNYVSALREQGIRAEPPVRRRSKAQLAIHERNAERICG